jgi:hypothetical protein
MELVVSLETEKARLALGRILFLKKENVFDTGIGFTFKYFADVYLMNVTVILNNKIHGEISGSHDGMYEDDGLLGFGARN